MKLKRLTQITPVTLFFTYMESRRGIRAMDYDVCLVWSPRNTPYVASPWSLLMQHTAYSLETIASPQNTDGSNPGKFRRARWLGAGFPKYTSIETTANLRLFLVSIRNQGNTAENMFNFFHNRRMHTEIRIVEERAKTCKLILNDVPVATAACVKNYEESHLAKSIYRSTQWRTQKLLATPNLQRRIWACLPHPVNDSARNSLSTRVYMPKTAMSFPRSNVRARQAAVSRYGLMSSVNNLKSSFNQIRLDFILLSNLILNTYVWKLKLIRMDLVSDSLNYLANFEWWNFHKDFNYIFYNYVVKYRIYSKFSRNFYGKLWFDESS